LRDQTPLTAEIAEKNAESAEKAKGFSDHLYFRFSGKIKSKAFTTEDAEKKNHRGKATGIFAIALMFPCNPVFSVV
jgi:hypothetical protein